MTARQDWDEVAEQISGLALKLKLHFEETAGAANEEARSALDAASEGVEKAFDGLKAAISDPAVKQDVRDVAAGLRDAMSHTFAEVSARVGRPDQK